MRRIDEQYLKIPFYGSRQLTRYLRREGFAVNRKRVQRLMRLMGLCAVYPRPRTTKPHPEHRIYPRTFCAIRSSIVPIRSGVLM